MQTVPQSRSRTAVLGLTIGVAYVTLLFVVLVWNGLLLRAMQHLHLNDLGKFYYDAQAFLAGAPMYQPSPATLIPITETTSKQLLNLNPPHFHLVLLPIAWLGPTTVATVWLLTGLVALGLSVRATFRTLDTVPSTERLLLGGLLLISSVAFGSVLVTGQVTLHLLPLVTWAWIAARTHRWTQAGVALGLAVSVKPFMLVFLPWLALRGRTGPVFTSVLVAGAAFASGIVVFGTQAWNGWLSAIGAIDWHGLPMNASFRGYLARIFDHTVSYHTVFDAPDIVIPIWVAGFVAIGLTSLTVVVLDRTPSATDRAFTLLLLAALLMAPLGWIYYVLLALPSTIGLFLRRADSLRTDPTGRALERARLVAAVAGGGLLLLPTAALLVPEPSTLHTLTVGSAHFWAVWCLWCAVVCDGLLARGPSSGPRLGKRQEA